MGREAELLEQQERREVEVLILAFFSFLFYLWNALLYLFIGLDVGKTAGEGKASYQGKIHQVYSTQPPFIRCLTEENYLYARCDSFFFREAELLSHRQGFTAQE